LRTHLNLLAIQIASYAGDNVVAKVGDFGLAAHGSSKMNEMLATWTWLAPGMDQFLFGGGDGDGDGGGGGGGGDDGGG